MKKLKLKLVLLMAACLCMVGFASADDAEDKDDEVKNVVCSILPLYCGATTQGGNGGGYEPPPAQ
jgi:hypothetical protein